MDKTGEHLQQNKLLKKNTTCSLLCVECRYKRYETRRWITWVIGQTAEGVEDKRG
jgi:hypothetical protein